ncbi:hypothetical protein C5Y96_10975 [Blastopirellula marina]|uniref:Knr4/Smi1-like domain-containing protein n=1 Tax=Blastopirellula marina TaxID=124 RepID=A0A2S8FNE4_9BACT|nr:MULTISPECIES: ankyrin repeat domain-containing protein [Pirellulaceae]PQO33364.1 hypothetical protein C5Y96_10975 [Blastopirellula marina]RCS52453.1 hypothetical protein DTL36_10985 [Bremerella cremea]
MTMKPIIQDSFPQASDSDLDKLENQCDILLPQSYRSFLKKTNGGSFPSDVYFGPDTSPVSIQLFYSINSEFDYLDLLLANLRLSWILPGKFLAIADTGLGDVICINSESERGEVWLISHETEANECLAGEFAKFIDEIRYSDHPDLVSWSETEEPFRSIEQGDLDAVALMAPLEFSTTSQFGYSMLECAAASRQPRIVEFLLGRGTEINSRTSDGMTPLILACRSGSVDVVATLLEYGARMEDIDSSGRTALLWALVRQHPRIAKLLIEKGADTSIKDKNGNTAFSLSQSLPLNKYILPLL